MIVVVLVALLAFAAAAFAVAVAAGALPMAAPVALTLGAAFTAVLDDVLFHELRVAREGVKIDTSVFD